MTGIAADPGTDNIRTGVVRVGTQKACSGMAVAAFRAGNRVGAGRGVVGGSCLTPGYSAIVTAGAGSGNARMIEATVCCQCQETGGIVAVITFCICRCVKFGFTNRRCTVMASAAVPKNFLVIDKRINGKSQRSMASLAGISGGDMIARFW